MKAPDNADVIYFDFETTNHRYGSALDERNRILMVSWAVNDGAVQTHRGDIMACNKFWQALRRCSIACAFHAKFEMLWLMRCGYNIDHKLWHDPMLGEKVLLGNLRERVNLDEVSQRYGLPAKDVMIDSMMKAGVCPSAMPQDRLAKRCETDVRNLRKLHKCILSRLHHNDQIHLYRNRCEFEVLLAHIEREGMQLDGIVVQAEYDSYVKTVAALSASLDALTGGINMNSPDQKAHFLYGKLKFKERKGPGGRCLRNKPSKQFPKGRPKTDKQTLAWLATQAATIKQKDFIRLSTAYSKAHAALSKNLEFFMGICREYGGKFFAQFSQIVAATHRLTSSGMPLPFKIFGGREKSVQFQNMPREFKKCFDAPDGYRIVELDFPQLEFRVAAFLGQDKQAMKDIRNPDFDAHIFSASKIYAVDYDALLKLYRSGNQGAKEMRQNAKPHTFKPLYGGTKGTPGEEAYYKEFAARYQGIAAAQENWLSDVIRTGEHWTAWRMHFSWDTFIDKRGVIMDRRAMKPVGPQVYNYPVQNLATAEIVPIALVALYKRCQEEGLDVKFVNTVHDSVVCYVKIAGPHLHKFRQAAKWAFTTAVYEHLRTFYNIEFNVPLGVEITSGTHWGKGTVTIHDDVNTWRQDHE